jgi:hypothetical protein
MSATTTRLDIIAHSAFQITTASIVGGVLHNIFPPGRDMTDMETLVEMLAQSSISSYLAYAIASGDSFVPDPLGGFVFAFVLFGSQQSLLEKARRVGDKFLSIGLSFRLRASGAKRTYPS